MFETQELLWGVRNAAGTSFSGTYKRGVRQRDARRPRGVVARHRHVLTGVVAPLRLHGAIAAALATHGLVAVARVQDVQRQQIPIFTAELVKGLEFDAVVVVVNSAEVFDGTPRGARLVYVAMTRAVQVLRMVGDTAFDPNSL